MQIALQVLFSIAGSKKANSCTFWTSELNINFKHQAWLVKIRLWHQDQGLYGDQHLHSTRSLGIPILCSFACESAKGRASLGPVPSWRIIP